MIHLPVAVQIPGVTRGVQSPVIILTNPPLPAEPCGAGNHLAITKHEAFIALGIVHPIVQTRNQTIVSMFNRSLFCITGNLGLPVALKIAIGILAEPNIWRLSHQHSTLNHGDSPGHDQTLKVIGLLVGSAIIICVLKDNHLAHLQGSLAGTGDIGHIPAHFDHPGTTVAIPGHAHRVNHHGFGSKKFQLEARSNFKGGKSLICGDRG